MIPESAFRSLDAVAAHLPFTLSETEKANETFQRWLQHGNDEDLVAVELWTYCYVCRYFLVRFVRRPDCATPDMELLVEKVSLAIHQRRHELRDGMRYANWVSVVCKHAFLNYRRSRRRILNIDALRIEYPDLQDDGLADAAQAFREVAAAIERLPPYLQEITRLRFFEGLDYEEIREATGRSPAVIRAYISRAIMLLRVDICAEH
jgi:RNA polymerase sigma factor (sigma-70 family)